MVDARDVARAIDAVRRGWPVRIDGAGARCLTVLPVEMADDAALAEFGREGCYVLLSGERAAALGLVDRSNEPASAAVRIAIEGASLLETATMLADPVFDTVDLQTLSVRVAPFVEADTADAAVKLARLARLLPAMFVRDDLSASTTVAAGAILSHDERQSFRIAARTVLPIRQSEACEMVAFRSSADAAEHVALVIGSPNGHLPLVRVHSECLTGDAFGSLRCDCGPQLDEALARIVASGWGLLLYLRQEGRGIGLVNKLRTYALQQRGLDTASANHRLGFGADVRDYGVAAQMLRLLGHTDIRLMTNNPSKVAALAAGGIVVDAERLSMGANPHNEAYLQTKLRTFGHLLS